MRALLGLLGIAVACQAETGPSAPQSTTAGGSSSGSAGASAGTASGGTASSGMAGAITTAGAAASAAAGAAGHGGASAESGNGGSSGGAGAGGASDAPMRPKRVLLYHFSTLKIDSLAAQLTLLTGELSAWGYEVEDSADPLALGSEHLQGFAAVAMINTCFEPFGQGQPGTSETAALTAFVAAGGGLFGTHCAAVTFQSAEPPHPYNALIGGRGGHGFFEGKSTCLIAAQHETTSALPATFEYSGNLDNADYVAADSTVLVKCTWSGDEQKDVAVSWFRTPGKGRVFYTNFAKEDVDLKSALGAQHVLPGLAWVLRR